MKHLKTYQLFESDSWVGSLYAYNSKIAPINTDPVIEPRKIYTLTCKDCGVDFDSFISGGVCSNCGSENVESSVYENTRPTKDILLDIDDMLYDVRDEGMIAQVGMRFSTKKEIQVYFIRDRTPDDLNADDRDYIIFSEIKETVQRIYAYMENDYNIHFEVNGTPLSEISKDWQFMGEFDEHRKWEWMDDLPPFYEFVIVCNRKSNSTY